MKCIHCNHDSKYSERKDTGRCPGCKHPFAFEPTKGDPFTDGLIQSAIEAVSSKGAVRFCVEHVYYEVCRRMYKKRTPVIVVWIVLTVGGVASFFLASYPFNYFIPLGFVAAAILATVIWHKRDDVKMSFFEFERYWFRWCEAHGAPKGLIVRKHPSRHPLAAEPDLGDYSFDRAVICDTVATVDLLLANQFHFENNCAVLSIDGYPPGPFDLVRKMLQRNPQLQVFVLHDATPEGCRMAHKLATDPDWFKGKAKIIDVGLRPVHANAFKGLWRAVSKKVTAGDGITASEGDWLSAYSLALAAVRPEQVLKRLFRAINRLPEPTATSSSNGGGGGGGGVLIIGDDSFSSEAGDADGGADAFG